MIARFRDGWLRLFFAQDVHSRHIPADIEGRLSRELQMIDGAFIDLDLSVPPSNYFETVHGKLVDFHSIGVTKQWRLIFGWDGSHGEARDICLDDHSYRWERPC